MLLSTGMPWFQAGRESLQLVDSRQGRKPDQHCAPRYAARNNKCRPESIVLGSVNSAL